MIDYRRGDKLPGQLRLILSIASTCNPRLIGNHVYVCIISSSMVDVGLRVDTDECVCPPNGTKIAQNTTVSSILIAPVVDDDPISMFAFFPIGLTNLNCGYLPRGH